MSDAATEKKLTGLLQVIITTVAKWPAGPIVRYPNEALLAFNVDPKDQGRFIGKSGTTIWAIQTLFWFAGLAQCGYSYTARLLEPQSPIPKHLRAPTPFKFNPEWDRKKLANLFDTIIAVCIPLHATYSIRELDETNAIVHLKLQKYLECQLRDPSFPEAFETIARVAGMSQGVAITSEVVFE